MNFGAVLELFRILLSSYEAFALWLLIASIPWVIAILIRLFRSPSSVIYKTGLCAAAVAALFWLVTLLTVAEANEQAAVNALFLLSLYYSLPVWLIIWSVFGATAFVYRKVAGVPEEEEEDDDEPPPDDPRSAT